MSSTLPKTEPSERIDMEIDTSGLRCPLPLLRAKQALKTMQVGDLLRVIATDPAAKPDFDAMLRHLPHDMVSYQRVDSTDVDSSYPWMDIIVIRKGGGE